MNTELLPMPLTNREQAKLLNVPAAAIRAYKNGSRNLPEKDLEKLDFLEHCWQEQLNPKALTGQPDFPYDNRQVKELRDEMKMRWLRLDYQMWKYRLQLLVLENSFTEMLPRYRLLETLMKAATPDSFDQPEIEWLYRTMCRRMHSCGPAAQLKLRQGMYVVEAEQNAVQQMLDQLKTILNSNLGL